MKIFNKIFKLRKKAVILRLTDYDMHVIASSAASHALVVHNQKRNYHPSFQKLFNKLYPYLPEESRGIIIKSLYSNAESTGIKIDQFRDMIMDSNLTVMMPHLAGIENNTKKKKKFALTPSEKNWYDTHADKSEYPQKPPGR